MLRATFDDSGVAYTLRNLERFTGNQRRLLERIANYAKIRILDRTAQGKGADEKFFKDYSTGYKFFREKTGRPSAKADLFFSGTMLAAMQVKTGRNRAMLYFSDQAQAKKAAGHDFGNRRLPQRPFFAVSVKDLKGIDRILEQALRGVH